LKLLSVALRLLAWAELFNLFLLVLLCPALQALRVLVALLLVQFPVH
jgi:hypothetical protein